MKLLLQRYYFRQGYAQGMKTGQGDYTFKYCRSFYNFHSGLFELTIIKKFIEANFNKLSFNLNRYSISVIFTNYFLQG
jgi:hypothetical protein